MIGDSGGFSQNKLSMRLARKSDARRLLSWRNHESVRRYSKNSELISWEIHEQWLEKKLEPAQSESKILVFSELHHCVGMCRLDSLIDGAAEISILVDPEVHGQGLGSKILGQSIDYAFHELNFAELQASIHSGNSASLALFSKFGFTKIRQNNSFDSYRLPKIS